MIAAMLVLCTSSPTKKWGRGGGAGLMFYPSKTLNSFFYESKSFRRTRTFNPIFVKKQSSKWIDKADKPFKSTVIYSDGCCVARKVSFFQKAFSFSLEMKFQTNSCSYMFIIVILSIPMYCIHTTIKH